MAQRRKLQTSPNAPPERQNHPPHFNLLRFYALRAVANKATSRQHVSARETRTLRNGKIFLNMHKQARKQASKPANERASERGSKHASRAKRQTCQQAISQPTTLPIYLAQPAFKRRVLEGFSNFTSEFERLSSRSGAFNPACEGN